MQPFPGDFPTEVWLEVHPPFSPAFLVLSTVTDFGKGRIVGPVLTLLDVESLASITQATNVCQPLGRGPTATP